MKINFVTTNTLKFEIARSYLSKLAGDCELVQYSIDTPEIQDNSVEQIAIRSAFWAVKETGEACVKTDVGFFIEELKGFPGPFVKYVNEWLSQEDVIRLMHGKLNRNAYFKDSMAIAFPDGSSSVFTTKVIGRLADAPDPNNQRWTMNSLFIPKGYDRTLGSMSDDEQGKFWENGLWPQLIEYLKSG